MKAILIFLGVIFIEALVAFVVVKLNEEYEPYDK
jgi:hypothetical protein